MLTCFCLVSFVSLKNIGWSPCQVTFLAVLGGPSAVTLDQFPGAHLHILNWDESDVDSTLVPLITKSYSNSCIWSERENILGTLRSYSCSLGIREFHGLVQWNSIDYTWGMQRLHWRSSEVNHKLPRKKTHISNISTVIICFIDFYLVVGKQKTVAK